MASYATVAQMRGNLDQLKAGAVETALLQDKLDSAQDLIDLELGFAFAGYLTAAAAQSFSTRAGRLLHLPYYQAGTLTAVALVYEDDGRPAAPAYSSLTLPAAWPFTDYEAESDDHTYLWRPSGWPGGRYTATAKWGYGTASDSIVELCLEVARDLWFAREASMSSEVAGVQGAGAVPIQYAWTHRQYKVLQKIKLLYGDDGVSS